MLKEHFGPKNKWLLIHQENGFQKVQTERILTADCCRNEQKSEFNSSSLPNNKILNYNKTPWTMIWRLLIKLPWASVQVMHLSRLRFTHNSLPLPSVLLWTTSSVLHLMCGSIFSRLTQGLISFDIQASWIITVFTSYHVYALRFLLIM